MIRTRKSTTRLVLEELEPRWTPAGNVTAQMVDPFGTGTATFLSIVGDNEGNEIRVVEDAPGHVRIEGLGTTTINGKAADDLFSAGISIEFAEIDLGNGDDSLIHDFTGGQHPHGTIIDAGAGDDSVTVFVKGWVGSLGIVTAVGNDSVTIDLAPASVLFPGLHVNTGVGDDSVLFRANSDGGLPELWGAFFGIETEQGNDVVRFEGLFARLGGVPLFVYLGAGDDTLIGDSDSSHSSFVVEALGGSGHDIVLNAAYFPGAVYPDFWAHHLFETIA